MTAVAWTPGSSTVAVSDKDGSIYLWNPATGRARGRPLTIPGAGRAYTAAISPDGTLLAAGYSDGTTYLWSLASRHLLAALPDPDPVAGQQVDSVAFSPDGQTLVTADGNGAAYVWPITPANQTTVPAMTLPDPAGAGVWSVVFSSRGTLATGDYAGHVYLWDLTSGTATGSFDIPGGIPVTALAFSPGGAILAAGSGSAASGVGSLYLFSPSAGAGRFLGAVGPVWALSFAGRSLAAADGDGQTYLWLVSPAGLTASVAATLPDPNPGTEGVGALAFSPGRQWLVTGDTNGLAYVWMLR